MNDRYQTPLAERYASKEMQYIFSPDMKFKTWRKLWIALAETEAELGLPITQEQIDELKAHQDDINYEDAKKREKEVRHDVMSHVYAYGLQCPKAKGIIHLGATSCYVGDNTDIIIMTEGLKLVRKKLVMLSTSYLNSLISIRHSQHWLSHISSQHSLQQLAKELHSGSMSLLWILKILIMCYQQ